MSDGGNINELGFAKFSADRRSRKQKVDQKLADRIALGFQNVQSSSLGKLWLPFQARLDANADAQGQTSQLTTDSWRSVAGSADPFGIARQLRNSCLNTSYTGLNG